LFLHTVPQIHFFSLSIYFLKEHFSPLIIIVFSKQVEYSIHDHLYLKKKKTQKEIQDV